MALDKHPDGEPIEDTGPEWATVEAERDYWKALALSYGAKLGALEHTLKASWTVVHRTDGSWIEREDGLIAYPLEGIDVTLDKQ